MWSIFGNMFGSSDDIYGRLFGVIVLRGRSGGSIAGSRITGSAATNPRVTGALVTVRR